MGSMPEKSVKKDSKSYRRYVGVIKQIARLVDQLSRTENCYVISSHKHTKIEKPLASKKSLELIELLV